MLPNHSKYGFDFIFSNLKYIILDELHVYRGAFGSHLANVFRRLTRICRYYHADPQFLCSSATIANPLELAEKICGRSFINIARSGAGISERIYCLVQPEEKLNKDGIPYGICYKCCRGPSSSADGTKRKLSGICQIQKKCGDPGERNQRPSGCGRVLRYSQKRRNLRVPWRLHSSGEKKHRTAYDQRLSPA